MKLFSFTFRILLIFIFFGWMKGIAQSSDQNNEPVRRVVEEMPRAAGCDHMEKGELRNDCHKEKIKDFIKENLQYPPIAYDNGVQGTVIIRFIVEKDGSLSNVRIIKNIGAGCGKEAARLVNLMPKWTPGKLNNQPVRVEVNLPVKFEI